MSQSTFRSLRLAVVAVVVFALFGASRRVEATTVVSMDVAELSDQAELVFTGTAVQTRVVRAQDGDPYTFVTFTVRDVLKGWTMDKQIALRFAGGETADGVTSLEGMPQFEQGETYLLFVHGNGELLCPVLGWWQGQYRFSRQAGSGKQLLLDSNGVALSGVEKGRFQRMERGARHAEAEMTVLSEEGVHVEVADRTPRVSVTAEAADATQVVEQLRSFIAGRASAATFRPGKRVASARPEGLPAARQQ
ncbi:MAG TPA: hypothetical protein VGD79_06490 [Thermoanaerobaculia bacterium]|jgi:hypothetical protein